MSVRRQALIDCFAAARPRWLSLDVFDTLLWRPVGKPVEIFPEVHRHLAQSGHRLALGADEFARARIEAEQAARRRQPSAEICIDELCTELSAALGGRPEAAALAEAELCAERAGIRLDGDIAALVLHAAGHGVPYILVSDMYLRSAHLLELLAAAAKRAGIALPPPAHVFVSGERRTNKATGMFDLVLATLGCAPAELLHVGDNGLVDVEVPAKRGVRVFHFFRDCHYAERVFDLEPRFLASVGPRDFGLRATRAKALLSRHHASDAPSRPFHYGALILGPLLAGFAEWVAAQCHARRQRRVYCLMREGHLVAPLVEMAARALALDLDVRTLWTSRYALRGATFERASEAELRGYFYKRHRVPLATVSRDLGVDEAELRRASAVAHERGLEPAEVGAVIDVLVRTPALRTQVLETAAEKRRRLMRYFEGAGVLDEERLAIVDVGWAGSQQRYLAQLFAGSPRPREIHGLYFATHAGLLEMGLGNCSADSFLLHLGLPTEVSGCLQRTPEIIENACMPQAGSFMEIDDEGQVRHFPQHLPAAQLAQIAELQEGILRFAELWLSAAPERRAIMTHLDWQHHLERLRAVLARSLQDPLLEEVVLFQDWQHECNDGSLLVEPLIGSEALRVRARGMTYRGIRDLSPMDSYWPQGLACLVGKTAEARWGRFFGRKARG